MQANNWDDKYRDHAWREMRKLLDKDLPVAPIPWWRKWGLLALLLLFLIPLAGSAVWYAFGAGSKDEQAVAESVANIPSNATPPSSNAGIVNETDTEDASEILSLPTSAYGTAVNEQAPTDVQIPSEPEVIILPTKIEEDQLPILPLQKATAPAPELEKRSFELPLDLLPAEPIAGLNTTTQFPSLDQESIEPISNRLQWGLTGSIQAGNFPGFTGGIAVREALGNSRWSWQSGMEVMFQRYMRNDAELLALADDLEMPVDMNDTTIMEPNTFEENNSIGAGPREVYYLGLSVPVTMAYRISPAFRLNAGIRARYLLTSGNKPQDVLSGNKRVDYDLFLTNGAVNFQSPLYAQFNRQRFGLAATAGLEWQLGPRMSISSQLLFGVLDENKTKDGFQNRLAGELRLSYFFNRPTR